MKTLKQNYQGLMAIAALSIMLATAIPSFGGDYYRHDDRGYWDPHYCHHPYAYYHNHRGYWDQRNGVRVFINL